MTYILKKTAMPAWYNAMHNEPLHSFSAKGLDAGV